MVVMIAVDIVVLYFVKELNEIKGFQSGCSGR